MSEERRRWRCPECHREYLIPIAADDPMACRRCVGARLWMPSWRPIPTSQTTEAKGAEPSSAEDAFWEHSFWGGPSQSEPREEPFAGADGGRDAARGMENRSRRGSNRTLLLLGALLGATLVVGGMRFREELRRLSPEALLDGGKPLLVGLPNVRRNPRENAPLAALVDFETRRPTTAAIEIDDGERRWTYRPGGPATTRHRHVVLGLRPGRSHEVCVRVTPAGEDAGQRSEPLYVSTPPLPADFPPLRTTLSVPERMEPGVTVFSPNLWRDGERVYDHGYLIAVDAAGEVVWYLRTDSRIADLRLLDNGHLLYNEAGYHGVFEVDLLGNPVRRWWASGVADPPSDAFIPVPVDSLHHEVMELPSGNFLALSTELRSVGDFPASEADPEGATARATVVGDEVVEFEPDGTVVDRLQLFDLLDPHRIGYGAFTDFWKGHYGEVTDDQDHDWSHANAFHYDAADDTVIISVRHQDCLVKVDRRAKRIEWILGDPDGWDEPWRRHLLRPRGEMQWPYHQHGAERTPAGTILLYDNGNFQAVPPEPKRPAVRNHSRVVEFAVDEETRSVEQVWEYGGPDDEMFYAPFYGDADWLPKTGNVLVTDGGRIETVDGMPADAIPADHQWGRIFEVTRTRPAEKVFEIVVDSGSGSGTGWSIYRSERLPDLATLSDRARAARAE